MTSDIDDSDEPRDWRTPADRARDIAQADALREQASQGGLRFEVVLPCGLAEWVLDFVERGVFVDPSESVFVILGERKDLEPHNDLRTELLKRTLEASMNYTRPPVTLDEFKKRMAERMAEPRPEPAIWHKKYLLLNVTLPHC
jgi:hypothetical protein